MIIRFLERLVAGLIGFIIGFGLCYILILLKVLH